MSRTCGTERTVVDVFRELVEGKLEDTRGLQWKITRLTDPKNRLSSGLAYCFAEVTFENGTQYGTEAFGDDAIALHTAASLYPSTGSKQETPMLLAM